MKRRNKVKVFCGFKSRNRLDQLTGNALRNLGYRVDTYHFFTNKKDTKSLFIYHKSRYIAVLINLFFPVFIFRFLLIFLRYDVYFFFAGYSLITIPLQWQRLENLRYLDLFLLKILGKKIVYTFQGSELRNRDVANQKTLNTYWKSKAINKRKKIRQRVFKYADKILLTTPDLFDSVDEEFLHKTEVCLKPPPMGIAINQGEKKKKNSDKFRIIHAPTNRAIKGTDYIIAAVNQLAKTHNIELILVERKTRKELVQIAQTCDMAIDQVNIGWYGSFALEMLTLGLPVMCHINNDSIGKSGLIRVEVPIFDISKTGIVDDISYAMEQISSRDFHLNHKKKTDIYLTKHHSIKSFEKKVDSFMNSLDCN